MHSAGKQTSILTEWKDGTFSSSIDKDGSNITLGKNPSRTSWQHVVFVKQATDNGLKKSLKVYLNGVEVGKGSWTETLPSGMVGLQLGSWGKDATQPMAQNVFRVRWTNCAYMTRL